MNAHRKCEVAIGLVSILALAGLAHGQGQIVRASITPTGGQTFSGVEFPVVSYDGTVVAFGVYDSALFEPSRGFLGASNSVAVKDLNTGSVQKVSQLPSGYEAYSPDAIAISGDGRWVYFSAYYYDITIGNEFNIILVHDRENGTTTRLPIGLNSSGFLGYVSDLRTSHDGRYLVFITFAGDVVPNDSNERNDAFLFDRDMGTTEIISQGVNATQSNNDSFSVSVSNDGRYVAFESYASNLVTGDTNASGDVFLRDRQLGTTQRLSMLTNGSESGYGGYAPHMSRASRDIVFFMYMNPLRGTSASVFLRRSDGNGGYLPAQQILIPDYHGAPFVSMHSLMLSDDGTKLALIGTVSGGHSESTGDDVFFLDLTSGELARASQSMSGQPASPSRGEYSGDGRSYVFESLVADIVPDDTNNEEDVFVSGPCVEPVITQNPLSETEGIGAHAIFYVKAVGAGRVSYRWRKDGKPLQDDSRLIGTQEPILLINPVMSDDAGQYDVILSTLCGEDVVSASADLQIGVDATCAGDTNNDGMLDMKDISHVLLNWGSCFAR